ncbi:MAG: tol-pal system protein YbgF [Pseudomonadota bacterium]
MTRVSYFNFQIFQRTWMLATITLCTGAAMAAPVTVESLDVLNMLEEPSTNESTAPVNPLFESDAGFQADASLGSAESQYQVQLLKQEVSELRGLVEELSYQLQRLSSVSDDRYLELDRRFQDVQASVHTLTTTASGPGADVEINPVVVDAPVVSVPGDSSDMPSRDVEIPSEKALYDTALELIRNRQYEMATEQLRATIESYPDGRLTPNAYYWLGQAYAAMPRPEYEKSRQALAQVITFYPEHQKVPDAAFKLGTVHHLMGDCSRASELLNQVIEQHSGKTVAKLAENYLRDKVDCES